MGAELGAVISTAGSLAGSGLDAYMGRENMMDQMHFQRTMSNTAHFREVQDLIRAGLNPILSAKYGGSSTPGGASAPPTDFASSAQGMGQLALQKERLHKELQVLASDAENKQADTALKQKQGQTQDAQTASVVLGNQRQAAELNNLATEAAILKANLEAIESSTRSKNYEQVRQGLEAQMYNDYPWLVPTEKATDIGGQILDRLMPGNIVEDVIGKKKSGEGARPPRTPSEKPSDPVWRKDSSKRPARRRY